MSARVGQLVGPVETQYGYHLIEVTDRADQEVQIADLAHQIRADVATLSRIQERLDDLHYYAAESGDFAGEAQRMNLTPQQVTIQEGQEFIPGLGSSATIFNFLNDASKGDVSDVIELNDQFVVLQLQEIQPEGFRSLEEVRAELEPRVRVAKKAEIQAGRLEQAMSGSSDLNAVALKVGSEVREASGVAFNSPVVTGLGREPKFTGTALGLEEGETSSVIEGETAAYVLRVTAVHEPPPMTETQREQLRNQLLEQKRATVRMQWLTSLREKAKIEDNRRFFIQ